MNIYGWCEDCRRVKQVRVSNAGMIALQRNGVATGICASCHQDEDDRRRGIGKSHG